MSQEYQVFFLQSYLDQMEALPWLCGYDWWNFADFGWARSSNPPLLNNKGLLTFDRQKKDSFYYLKAHWTGANCWPTAGTLLPQTSGTSIRSHRSDERAASANPFSETKRE